MTYNNIHIGTCSWKYDSWRGLIYPDGPINFLQEYCSHYRTVEVDQWFWSLFKGDKVVLPRADVVREYAEVVPEGFRFAIKVPNSITLTHHYNKDKKGPLRQNPNFLSLELMNRFLDTLKPLSDHLGPLIFQFEYLNKQKMPTLSQFLEFFGAFTEQLPNGFTYTVETRNPNYLQESYFEMIRSQGLHHVFLHGYYMPPIFEVYEKYREYIKDLTVIRLHGPGRQDIEKQTGKEWNQIVAPKDRDIDRLATMLGDLAERQVETFLYVNNHFEGSAPRTISRIESSLPNHTI